MANKPVILTVDVDPEVLRAIERDLRREYGSRYRILRADSATKALAALRELSAGDVRHQSVKRVASAVGEGSIAVQFIHQYLASTVQARLQPGGDASDARGIATGATLCQSLR